MIERSITTSGQAPPAEAESAWRARFEALARAVDGVVYRRDAAGQWHWQGSLAELLGGGPHVLGLGSDAWLARVHPAERDALALAYDRREHEHAALAAEYRITNADGSLRWVREHSRYVTVEGALELVGTLGDITGQRGAEADKRDSERRLRQLADQVPAIVFATDPVGRVVFTNQRWADYTGLSLDDAGDWLESVHPDDRQRLQLAFKHAIDSATPYRYEMRRRRYDGAWRWWLTQAEPQLDADGRVVQWIGSSLDIHDLKEAQAQLRDTEQRLQLAVDAASMATWSWDSTSNRMVASDNSVDVLGYRPDRLGQGWQYVHPDDIDRLRAAIDEGTRSGNSIVIAYRQYRPDTGELRWLEVHAQMTLDAEGRPARFMGVSLDITERKRVDDALRQSEHRFRTLADTAPVLIWTSAPEGHADWFNKPWLDFTGRSLQQDVAGWADLVHPDDLTATRAALDAAYAVRQPFALQYRLRRRDGVYRWLLDNGHPRFDGQGDFLGYVGSCTDISDQKAAEAALRDADRRKDEFLATLGHELRNPLAPMRNAVHILKSHPTQPPSEALLGIMDRQITHLVRLVDDLLEISRITRGKIELRREPVDLRSVAKSAVEIMRSQIERAKHTLELVLPDEPVWIDGDHMRLEQVVANLLNNATKYSDDGGHIALTLGLRGSEALLRVADHGVGIPRDMLGKIFEMFTQVDRAARRGQGGLGIGLSLVRMLVTMHEGRVDAHSDGPGQGSTFTISLPLIEAQVAQAAGDDAAAAAAMPEPPAGAPDLRGRRVLVVDDNRDAAESLATLVSDIGGDVRIAYDGPGALFEAKEFLPEAVLLDIGMPGMDGYEVARRLRRRDTDKPVLIIAVTGWGQQEDRNASEAAGFDLHLVKPANLEMLQAALAGLETETAAG